jgi:hypothetical protein
MTFTVRSVPPSLLERLWPFAEPFIKRALDQATGEFSANDIKKFCENETLRLLLVFDGARIVAAATCELVQYPTMRRLRVVHLGGTGFDDWIAELDAALVNVARELECSSLEAFVRKGFVRKLADWRWKQRYVMVVKELPL